MRPIVGILLVGFVALMACNREKDEIAYILGSIVKVKKSPDTKSVAIDRIERGALVIVKKRDLGWAQIRFSGSTTGWVRERDIGPNPPGPKVYDSNSDTAGYNSKKANPRTSLPEERSRTDIDKYIAALTDAGRYGRVIVRITENGNRDRIKITVSNAWHSVSYQVRLQGAQNLWKIWAALHSPYEPDKARISIVDLNGNEVGGSRMWGGSLIWVQDR